MIEDEYARAMQHGQRGIQPDSRICTSCLTWESRKGACYCAQCGGLLSFTNALLGGVLGSMDLRFALGGSNESR